MRIFLCLIILLTTAIFPISAQHFFEFGVENGLSDRKVISIQRDLQGFTWLLTNKGVDRFDGSKFTHYKIQCEERDYYFFPEIHKLRIDKEGNILVMGLDGYIFKYSPDYDSFETTVNFYKEKPEESGHPIKIVYLDSKENIWISTKNKQYIYNLDNQNFTQIQSNLPEDITCITEGDNNEYYFAEHNFIYRGKLRENKLIELISGHTENKGARINYLYFHKPTEKLMVGTIFNGIFLYDIKNEQLNELPLSLKDIAINSICVNPNNENELIIATDGNGAYKLNFESNEITNIFKNAITIKNNINDRNIIKDALIDPQERIWAATYPNGFIVYNPQLPNYIRISRSTPVGADIASNRVNHIMQDSDGEFWFATNNGLSRYNPQNKKWDVYFSSETHDASNNNHVFLTVTEISKGVIMAGGYMSGMYIINKQTMKKEYTSMKYSEKGIYPDKYIRSIFRDETGMVWIGGYYYLRKYDPANDMVIQIRTEYPINDIKTRNSKTLWVATIHGLYIYDKQTNQLTPYLKEERINNINSIYQTRDGKQTYIATYGSGLYILNNETKDITHLTTHNSKILSNNIYAILSNQKEELFLTGESSIAIYNKKNHKITNWTEDEGLFKAKFNQNAVCRSNIGNLLFGTSEGVFMINENIKLLHTSSCKMVLNSLTIGDEKILPNRPGSPLKKLLDQTTDLTLTSEQNTFSIDVSSINYDNPASVYYSYMLEGYHNQWSKMNENSRLEFTNIKPGSYKLKIKSIRADDYKIIEKRTLNITILPPIWLTWWAISLYILISIAIIVGVIRYLIIAKERKNSLDKIQFFKNTAHDIRTPLTLIKAPLSEIQRTENLSDNGKRNLALAIQNADNLNELSTNLINFEKEELYTETLRVNKFDLNKYVRAYIEPYKDFASQKGLSLVFKTTLTEKLEVWIDKNKMDSILRNLLTNAMKYTPANGVVTVETGKDKNFWTIQISDTGMGISEKDQKRMFKVMFRGKNAINQQTTGCGIGMLLTARLIRNHEGKISLKSKENEGTTFFLTFPIDSKRYQHTALEHDLVEKKDLSKWVSNIIRTSLENESEQDKQASTENKYTILIVEDNVELSRFLTQMLSREYNVETAENGQEGIKAIKKNQPDIIISDIMMPVMDGDKMCEQIKSNIATSHIPVILLTALDDKENIIKGLKNKADLYITKPFDIEVLKANISNLLENRERIKKFFATGEIKTITKDDAIQMAAMEMVSTLDNEFIQKVTDSIQRNLTNNLTVDTICAELNMSRSSFYNKIKALSGMAPADFVRQIKMNEASILLKTKRYSVSEVAEKLGFADPKYFTDVFKKYYNMSPTAYMKLQEQEKDKE